jgi:hypothetical protein
VPTQGADAFVAQRPSAQIEAHCRKKTAPKIFVFFYIKK